MSYATMPCLSIDFILSLKKEDEMVLVSVNIFNVEI